MRPSPEAPVPHQPESAANTWTSQIGAFFPFQKSTNPTRVQQALSDLDCYLNDSLQFHTNYQLLI